MLVGRDSDDGRQRQLRERVGRDVADGRVRQELHDHADVVRHRREHHRRQVHGGAARGVGLHQELGRRLAKVPDLVFDGLAHHHVVDRLKVDAALVRQVVKHVGGADGFGS